MLALFALRLAAGMIAALLVLIPSQVNPRFFRTHYLTAFGLTALATFLMRNLFFQDRPGMCLGVLLAASLLAAFAGSVIWSLRNAPGGRLWGVMSAVLFTAALAAAQWASAEDGPLAWLLLIDAASAAVLGAATSAMLMGHSYLIAPAMSIVPLMRLLGILFVALLLRMLLAGVGLWFWTAEHSLVNLSDVAVFWLPLRWGLGFIGPLVLGFMAWRTAKIRSTQSATGILYVVVVFCFLGELTGQLLLVATNNTLQ
jgi:hypothetical protein